MQLQGQHVLILGLGASGLAMARWCAHAGAEVTVADTREEPPQLKALQAECPQVQFVSGALAAGLVVLFAAVTATREERAREYAVLRALGASNQLLANVQRAELAGIGALAGLLATSVAMLMGWGLARFAFEFEWTASPWVPLLGAVVGALLALAAGWWGLRDVLRRPVVQTLRQAS